MASMPDLSGPFEMARTCCGKSLRLKMDPKTNQKVLEILPGRRDRIQNPDRWGVAKRRRDVGRRDEVRPARRRVRSGRPGSFSFRPKSDASTGCNTTVRRRDRSARCTRSARISSRNRSAPRTGSRTTSSSAMKRAPRQAPRCPRQFLFVPVQSRAGPNALSLESPPYAGKLFTEIIAGYAKPYEGPYEAHFKTGFENAQFPDLTGMNMMKSRIWRRSPGCSTGLQRRRQSLRRGRPLVQGDFGRVRALPRIPLWSSAGARSRPPARDTARRPAPPPQQ